jgi:hypothetical protein
VPYIVAPKSGQVMASLALDEELDDELCDEPLDEELLCDEPP